MQEPGTYTPLSARDRSGESSLAITASVAASIWAGVAHGLDATARMSPVAASQHHGGAASPRGAAARLLHPAVDGEHHVVAPGGSFPSAC